MSSPRHANASLCGAIVIGRNEGDRLKRCLESLAGRCQPLIYVDSASTDASVQAASERGADVVGLDVSLPFTAARARNEGFRRLRERAPEAVFVQFVDGDCEVVDGWVETAIAFLQDHPAHAVACGRRRERFPERSIYNRLCDFEWDTPVGDARACGGDAMMRVDAFERVGGFRPDLIAGEEPELCLRLRQQGWRIRRLDAEMTRHDAAITRFSQWWRRTMRAGFAFAEGAHLHGSSSERHWVRETRSAQLWALGVPLLALVAVVPACPIGLVVLLAYPLQMLRIAARLPGRPPERLLRALFLVLGKFAELVGQMRFQASRLARRRAPLIEYK